MAVNKIWVTTDGTYDNLWKILRDGQQGTPTNPSYPHFAGYGTALLNQKTHRNILVWILMSNPGGTAESLFDGPRTPIRVETTSFTYAVPDPNNVLELEAEIQQQVPGTYREKYDTWAAMDYCLRSKEIASG